MTVRPKATSVYINNRKTTMRFHSIEKRGIDAVCRKEGIDFEEFVARALADKEWLEVSRTVKVRLTMLEYLVPKFESTEQSISTWFRKRQ